MAEMKKMTTKHLRLETYDAYYNYPSAPSSSFHVYPLNEMIRLHGYFALRRENKRKAKILDALSEIDTLVNPRRSTLNETLSSSSPCLTLDEVNADLNSLNWLADVQIQSLESISFTTDNIDIDSSGLPEKRRRSRERKDKVRKVFDAIHLTKPRSKKNCVKRRCLSEILNIGHVFDRFS